MTARSRLPACPAGYHRERFLTHRRAGGSFFGSVAGRQRRNALPPANCRARDDASDAGRDHRARQALRLAPYTSMGTYIAETDPLVIERAQGSRLFDVDGRAYLDANSSWWSQSLGHSHPRLVAAVQRQAEKMFHCSLGGIAHPEAALLGQELCQVAPPGLSRVFFSDNGSTSVEVAVKLAVQYAAQNGAPQRTRFVALEGAFHGETVGATSLGGVEVFRRPFAGILFDCIHVASPGDASAYEHAFEELGRALD